MSQWGSAPARRTLAALFRIGWTEKRRAGSSHRVLCRQGWPDYLGKSGGPDACAAHGESTTTDGTGTFRFPGAQRFQAVAVLIGDPVAPVTICIDAGGGLTAAWAASFLGAQPPETLALVCEISDTTVAARRRGVAPSVERQAVCDPVR